ncbi:MAG: TlpA disulfide reductase family protein [Bacteroidales bacterium]|jgi:cytochrome c biogenesis protein CcmG/thiol:disulfide interchange protein DsbE|nr:TlpA family protein disulfide reductase [Bacteroidales bacterium]MDI9575606.1 TlpA disulfide reductase family protein [Bacteroidota bacterium]MDD3755883.1 TlpA disulfide reductase family protein [Bacteroidales bacterium]MDY0400951.1 TlpA disulfide reductase family protein [Bacteroidales bacterium]HHW59231.1 TlpA family protein disulfide reductase [Bacteroidales bacterium]
MNKLFLFFCLLISNFIFAQKPLPSINIFDINGNVFNTDSIKNENKPIIISFWATWCKPCLQELNAISDLYDEWEEMTGVKLYAISIDDQRTSATVSSFVKGKNWPFIILKDPNHDLKRLLGVNNIPHNFILDKNRDIVWIHTGYSIGSEEEIIEKVKQLLQNDF